MIGMTAFGAEPEALRKAMQSAFQRVMESGRYILGVEVERFEQAWAFECGVTGAVGVASGTDALEISLRALGVVPGDEVIVPAVTAFATVVGVLRSGASPVLADIDPDTGLMSLDSARRCITRRTRAIVLVHLYGQMRDMHQWSGLAAESGLHLVEDCAQAHGARYEGRGGGGWGSAGAYSFYPTKNLGALGDAGMIVTRSEPLAERARSLRNYGISQSSKRTELGLNSRLDELQAALLSARLEWLEGFTRRRGDVAMRYERGITNRRVRLLAPPVDVRAHSRHLFVVATANRQAFRSWLLDAGIETGVHYGLPLHREEVCAHLRRDPSGLGAAEEHSSTCVSLPCHPHLSDADCEAVVAAVNAY